MSNGALRDGDAILTADGFILYVFGYDHADDAYQAFLKYVPEQHASLFNMDWLEIRWKLGGATLRRARMLYSPEVHAELVRTFLESFPDYVRFSSELDRWMIVVPCELIDKVYIPSRQLSLLKRRGPSDLLEAKALELTEMLSKESGVPYGFFGVHGSISLGMQREGSDIDIAVYGGDHFRKTKKCLVELEDGQALALDRESELGMRRLNRGVFKGVNFVVNATRRFSEIARSRPIFRSLGVVEMTCQCVSAEEAVFRPAVYDVEDCQPMGDQEQSLDQVTKLVSMNGLYRDVLRVGDRVRARGMLEEVDEDGRRCLRFVIGSGLAGEYLKTVAD